jgi:RNA polymerase sigma-70 factor (ECF subfamily)
LEEQTLIKLCQSGDLAAFETLLSNYEKLVYNLCYHYFGNHGDAADVGQEALLRIFNKINDFNGKASFKTWLYRVVTNVCLDELRRRKIHPVSLEDIKEQGYEPATVGSDPEESVERQELSQLLMEILAQLSVAHRTVLFLKDVEGLEYHEIATVLGCNIGTVKSRLNRARCALRKRLFNEPRYCILVERGTKKKRRLERFESN